MDGDDREVYSGELPGDLSNVIRFPKAPDDTVRGPLETDRPQWDDCKHPRPLTLDVEAHKLVCSTCHQEIDAFDFLLDLAGKWERFNVGYLAAREQERATRARLEMLKRVEKNARARIRKQGVALTFPQARVVLSQLRGLQAVAIRAVGLDEARRQTRLAGVDEERLREALDVLSSQVNFDRESLSA